MQRRWQILLQKSFSKHVLKNGIAEKSLGMAQNQISAKNFRIPPFLQARKETHS